MKINICDFCGEPIKGDPIKIIPYFQKEDFTETICIPWSEQCSRIYCRKCTADLMSLIRMPVETIKRLKEAEATKDKEEAQKEEERAKKAKEILLNNM